MASGFIRFIVSKLLDTVERPDMSIEVYRIVVSMKVLYIPMLRIYIENVIYNVLTM